MGICFGDLLQAAGHFFKMSFFIKNIKSKGFLCSFEKKELFYVQNLLKLTVEEYKDHIDMAGQSFVVVKKI